MKSENKPHAKLHAKSAQHKVCVTDDINDSQINVNKYGSPDLLHEESYNLLVSTTKVSVYPTEGRL